MYVCSTPVCKAYPDTHACATIGEIGEEALLRMRDMYSHYQGEYNRKRKSLGKGMTLCWLSSAITTYPAHRCSSLLRAHLLIILLTTFYLLLLSPPFPLPRTYTHTHTHTHQTFHFSSQIASQSISHHLSFITLNPRLSLPNSLLLTSYRDADGTFLMMGVAELDNVCEALGLQLTEEDMEVRCVGLCRFLLCCVVWCGV